MDFFDIGRANAADRDFDEQFIFADSGDRHGFDAQIIGAAINHGAHGFRNFEHAENLPQRRGDAEKKVYPHLDCAGMIALWASVSSQSRKISKPFFRFAGKFRFVAAPVELDAAGVKRMVFENQLRALRRRQPVLRERQVAVLVVAIKFVADDGMADVREVDADLMFAAGAGQQSQQSKWLQLSF